jgi:hypothetical protein
VEGSLKSQGDTAEVSTPRCAAHAAAATHRCDGCGELLCEKCIEVGHRLLFCVLCGERALPLEERGPESAPELAKVHRRREPYHLRDALRYPLRGFGGYVFWATLATLAVLLLAWALAPGVLGLVALSLLIFLLLLVPGLSFAIVRATAEGENELPDWPEWSGERATELGALLVLVLMTMVPGVALVSLAGCDVGHVAAERRCVLLTGVGLLAGLMVLVPALGATASFGNSWLAVRWDLHLRAFVRTWRDSTRLALALTGLYLLGAALGRVLSPLPLLGGLLQLAIHVYAWFLGMHLVGLLVRRHEAELEPIYFD